MLSFTDIVVAGGAQTMNLTSSLQQVNVFSLAGGAIGAKSPQAAVQADLTNNRLIVTPGLYLVDCLLEVIPNAEGLLTMQVRKNGVAQANLIVDVPCRQDVLTFTPSLSPANVAANTCAEQTFTVTGLLNTDKLLNVTKPANQAGLGLAGYRVNSTSSLSINYVNATAASIAPNQAESYKVVVGRFGNTFLRIFGYLSVLPTDSPGTIKQFPDPTSGPFAGQGGAPQFMVPIDLAILASANTPTITIVNARLAAAKLDG